MEKILENMKNRGLSASNIAFGQGGGLLQQLDRDTLKFAMKASAININGTWRDVYKDPVTDNGKRSKKKQLALTCNTGKYETVKAPIPNSENVLKIVFYNGKLNIDLDFSEIRDNANNS